MAQHKTPEMHGSRRDKEGKTDVNNYTPRVNCKREKIRGGEGQDRGQRTAITHKEA